MIVLSEAGQLGFSASAAAVDRTTEVARLLGCRVYPIPPDYEECETAVNALWLVPAQDSPVRAVWLGYLPSRERYNGTYAAAAVKNVFLINDPAQHATAMEFDLAYPHLKGVTPESAVARSVADAEEVALQIGLPVFMKGAVQSRKRQEWSSCVAATPTEVRRLAAWLLSLEDGSRGRVIVRRLAPLRHRRTTGLGMPVSREYRCFLYDSRLLERAYYWPEEDDFGPLSPEDQAQIQRLATIVGERLAVPYISLDVAQLEDLSWTAIEVNDGQFSGLAHVEPFRLWRQLVDAVK